MNSSSHPLLRVLSLIVALVLPVTPGAAEEGEEESPLQIAMEEMGRGMRTINKALTSADPAPAKADVLAALQNMQKLAVEGKVLVPITIEKLPEDERPAKIAAFRADLSAAIGVMLEVERAVLADDWVLAKEAFDRLRAARKDGHEKYNPEE